MKRVDKHRRSSQRESSRDAALAEARYNVGFRSAGQTSLHQPRGQFYRWLIKSAARLQPSARGNAENFIKLHKSQLSSDRTSCRDPKANQFRLILHTAAYWLMLAMRGAVPARAQLSYAEFATMRLRLIKIAARVVEGAARIRVYLPTACPDRAVFRIWHWHGSKIRHPASSFPLPSTCPFGRR
jgi:Transposase DDE domain group 1